MTDVEGLAAAFESGELLRPTPAVPNLVDLSRTIASLCGVNGFERTPGMAAIAEPIGDAEHLVLVLADGLGVQMLDSMPADAFLRHHLAMELRTVFPATTAVALTTLATGEWPAQHGITGWWTYLREIVGAATVLRFERRSDGKSLHELGVEPGQLLPVPSLLPRMQRDVLSLYPRAIAESAYSAYFAGGTARLAYSSLSRAIGSVLERIESARGPTFTYLYTDRIDAAAHDYGTGDHNVAVELLTLDREIERLAAGLGGRARVVLTADHGHEDVPPARRHVLDADDDFVATLRVAPSYDSRVMCFHLRPGAGAGFREAVARRLGERVFVLSVDEVEAMGLLGPGALPPLTRERLGDFVAIVRGADAIGFGAATGGREFIALASHHSGLTPAQMLIPLVVA